MDNNILQSKDKTHEVELNIQKSIKKEEELVKKMRSLDGKKISSSFDYDKVSSLSSEGRGKLKKIKPETLGEASRISGVSPSDVSVLMIYLNKTGS